MAKEQMARGASGSASFQSLLQQCCVEIPDTAALLSIGYRPATFLEVSLATWPLLFLTFEHPVTDGAGCEVPLSTGGTLRSTWA
jgi:hypothetical protein